MGPGRLMSFPPRIWTVDVRTRGGAVTAECRNCGPVREHGTQTRAVRRTVISHLAGHARRDLTPPHLRTCQCGRRGCPWHRRHRGCSGPVLLALAREAGSHVWRLADLCRQCCLAIPHTAVVRHAAPFTTAVEDIGSNSGTTENEEDQLVWEAVCPHCEGPAPTDECGHWPGPCTARGQRLEG